MKNPPTLLYEKFTPVTPKKESCKNINRSRRYKSLFVRHFGKTRFEIWPLLRFLEVFIGSNGQIKSN